MKCDAALCTNRVEHLVDVNKSRFELLHFRVCNIHLKLVLLVYEQYGPTVQAIPRLRASNCPDDTCV